MAGLVSASAEVYLSFLIQIKPKSNGPTDQDFNQRQDWIHTTQ